jgi:hypothetical protein
MHAHAPLTVAQVLAWADEHRRRTGAWPSTSSGPVSEASTETWRGIDQALRLGLRGLPPGDTLRRLLRRARGAGDRRLRPSLSEAQIIAWAQSHYARTGRWPNSRSGAIAEAPGETWGGINTALGEGYRGLPGGDTLPRLLSRLCGAHRPEPAPLTAEQVLHWADEHRERFGAWPRAESGSVLAAPTETWADIDRALRCGLRGLPRARSLAWFLSRHRDKCYGSGKPRLSAEKIIAWGEAYYLRTGGWPTQASGPVADEPGENWSALNEALRWGHRGLPGGDTLARLLARHRGTEPAPAGRQPAATALPEWYVAAATTGAP